MSYVMRTVTTYTNEWDFIHAFINSVLSADTNITLVTDITELEAQYSDTSAKPAFTFGVGAMYTITFTRDTIISNATDTYVLTSNAAPGVLTNIRFRDNSQNASATAVRCFKYMIVGNSGCINMRLAGYNYSDVKASPQISLLAFRANAYSGRGYSFGSNNISSAIYYMTDTASTPVKKTDRLPYIYDESNENAVEMIKNKVFLTSGTSNRKVTVSGLYDVSTVTKDTLRVIDSKRYYSLDEHTIMEV